MGCDIHEYIETKNNDGKWERMVTRPQQIFREIYYSNDENKPTEKEREKLREEMWNHPLDLGRNYDLFAILADVRNGRGFAGIVTGSGFNPISNPRGLPDDASEGVLDAYATKYDPEDYDEDYTYEDWEKQARKWVEQGYSEILTEDPLRISCPDWHSASYYTLKELLDYDGWDQTTVRTGVVSQESYAKWDRDKPGFPPEMSGSVMGMFVEHISEEEMQKRIADGLPSQEDGERENHDGTLVAGKVTYYTQVGFEIKYRDCCSHFVDKFIPELKRIADEQLGGDYERLRFVFWFDN